MLHSARADRILRYFIIYRNLAVFCCDRVFGYIFDIIYTTAIWECSPVWQFFLKKISWLSQKPSEIPLYFALYFPKLFFNCSENSKNFSFFYLLCFSTLERYYVFVNYLSKYRDIFVNYLSHPLLTYSIR